jgi:hypothetical protein
MGRINPASKMDVIPLLLGFRKVVSRHRDRVFLVLAGPTDSYTRNLDSTIESLGLHGFVVHRDRIPYGNIPLYYSAADIFVSLSDTLQENFGLTPVEAMASGLPAVVSDWAGYQETVVHGVTGFKVRTSWIKCDDELTLLAPFYGWLQDHFYTAQSVAVDVEEAANYLDLLVRDESIRLEMGNKARQHVIDHFSAEEYAKAQWALWQELMQVAEGLPARIRSPESLMRPRYFQDFGHFASICLDGSARLELTERGRLVARGKEPLLLINDARQLLRADLLVKILRFTRTVSFMRQQISVDELESLLRKRGVAPSSTRQHVMWLLKYDLVRVQSGR